MITESIMSDLNQLEAISTGRVAVLAAQWHLEVVEPLVRGAQQRLAERAPQIVVDVFRVAGSFELSQASAQLAKSGKYQGIVCLGCLIRGETLHFELIAQTLFCALDQIGRETGVAVSVGVLTVENMAQALARAGGSLGNKGVEAVDAVLALALLLESACEV